MFDSMIISVLGDKYNKNLKETRPYQRIKKKLFCVIKKENPDPFHKIISWSSTESSVSKEESVTDSSRIYTTRKFSYCYNGERVF